MKTKLSCLLALLILFASCNSKAGIPPIDEVPLIRNQGKLQVWSIVPRSARMYQVGTKFSILGLGFKEGAKAFIGRSPCIKTTVHSGSQITCRIPAVEEPGNYSVTVQNPDGQIAPIENIPPLEWFDEYDQEDDDTLVTWLDDGLIYLEYVSIAKQTSERKEN